MPLYPRRQSLASVIEQEKLKESLRRKKAPVTIVVSLTENDLLNVTINGFHLNKAGYCQLKKDSDCDLYHNDFIECLKDIDLFDLKQWVETEQETIS